MMYLFENYPSPHRIWLAHYLLLLVAKPQDLEVILTNPRTLAKHPLYKLTGESIGYGLVSADVRTWRRHRKLIEPTFNQKILNDFIEVFAELSKTLIDMLSPNVGAGEFDVFPYISKFTLDSICATAMGIKMDAQHKELKYVKSVAKILEEIYQRGFKPWYHFDCVYNLTRDSKLARECINYVHAFTETVIRKRKQEYFSREEQSKGSMADSHHNGRWHRRKAFLDYFIELPENRNSLTTQELRDEVNTLVLAANDTTAAADSYALMMLGIYQDVQDKARKELDEIFGNSDRPPTVEDVKGMFYLERVIKETMRLFPSVPFIFREVTEPLQMGAWYIPSGVGIVVGILRTHRDPELWPEPLKFDPDRFLPEEVAKRHPYSYIPFSAGPRNCIGLRYAMIAMKVLVSTVLRSYKIESSYSRAEDIVLKSDITLKPVNGHMLKLVKLDKTPSSDSKHIHNQ